MIYYQDTTITLHHGHVLDVLPTLEAGSVDCVVTSPPYLGLRDYGVEGQIGLGQTPAEYVTSLRDVFREVRRILTDDGTCWINLGDSMWSGGVTGLGSGVPAYGTSGKAPGDYPDGDSSSCGQCGGRRESAHTDTHTSRTGTQHVSGSDPCEPDPSRVRTESRCPSLDSSGSTRRSGSPQSGPATLDPQPTSAPEPLQLHDVRVSTTRGSSPQPLAEYSRSGSNASSQLSPDSFAPDAREFEHTEGCICGTSRISVPSVGHTSGRESYGSAYPDSTSVSLPPKSLLLMPHRVAMALQEDGWTLRNAIVWNRPNAMPESVTDRLSTRYEMLFMFSKSRRYWFDLDPIREPHSEKSLYQQEVARRRPHAVGKAGTAVVPGQSAQSGMAAGGRELNASGANPGDVWTIPTTPFPGSHFAVFPPELPRRCIEAGCPPRRCTECGHAPTRTKGERQLDESRPQARRALQLAEQHGLTEEHIAAIRATGATDAGKAAVTQSGTGKNTDQVQRLAKEAKDALGGYFREFLLGRAASTGWTDCGHNAYRAGVVLDPFHGSGTTGMVATRNGRRYVGIELNKDYLDLSLRTRLADGVLDFEEPA